MTLEVQEPSWRAHSAHWCHESNSLATIEQVTSSLRLNSERHLLHRHSSARVSRVNNSIIGIGNNQEIRLPWWACIFTPESLEIDGTMIAAVTLEPEYTVDLYIGTSLLLLVVGVATSILVAILCALGKVEHLNDVVVCLVQSIGPQWVVGDTIGAFAMCEDQDWSEDQENDGCFHLFVGLL